MRPDTPSSARLAADPHFCDHHSGRGPAREARPSSRRIGCPNTKPTLANSAKKRTYIETRILTSVAGTIAQDLRFPDRLHDAAGANDDRISREILSRTTPVGPTITASAISSGFRGSPGTCSKQTGLGLSRLPARSRNVRRLIRPIFSVSAKANDRRSSCRVALNHGDSTRLCSALTFNSVQKSKICAQINC